MTKTKATMRLTGEDGNAMAILGRAKAALREADVDATEVAAFFAEATSGDYDHLLATCMAWIECDPEAVAHLAATAECDQCGMDLDAAHEPSGLCSDCTEGE